MLGSIYKISFKDSLKGYVGQTIKEPNDRLNEHIKSANRGSELAIHRAIRKHGVENIVFEIIELLPLYSDLEKQEFILDNKEIYYIDFFGTFGKNGYNLTKGGEGSLGREVSNYTRRLMSEKVKGRIVSDETKNKISVSQLERYKNNPRSKETSNKLSKANKGKVTVRNNEGVVMVVDVENEDYKNGKLVHISKNTKRTEEQLEKMSKVHKNKVMVEIDGKLTKIDRTDKRILDGELTITSNTKGLSIHSEDEKLKRSNRMTKNNPNAIIVEILNERGDIMFTSEGSFSKFLKENNLPNSLYESQRNGGTVIGNTPNSKARLTNQGYKNYIGWKAIKKENNV